MFTMRVLCPRSEMGFKTAWFQAEMDLLAHLLPPLCGSRHREVEEVPLLPLLPETLRV